MKRFGYILALAIAVLSAVSAHAQTEEEVSEEVVVVADSDDTGGGGVDVITLDPWMFEDHISTGHVIDLPTPGDLPGGGDDTPDDPCAQLQNTINQMRSVIAADQTAINGLNELIAQADSAAEKEALREEKRKVKDDIQQLKEAIDDLEQQMKDMDC